MLPCDLKVIDVLADLDQCRRMGEVGRGNSQGQVSENWKAGLGPSTEVGKTQVDPLGLLLLCSRISRNVSPLPAVAHQQPKMFIESITGQLAYLFQHKLGLCYESVA